MTNLSLSTIWGVRGTKDFRKMYFMDSEASEVFGMSHFFSIWVYKTIRDIIWTILPLPSTFEVMSGFDLVKLKNLNIQSIVADNVGCSTFQKLQKDVFHEIWRVRSHRDLTKSTYLRLNRHWRHYLDDFTSSQYIWSNESILSGEIKTDEHPFYRCRQCGVFEVRKTSERCILWILRRQKS